MRVALTLALLWPLSGNAGEPKLPVGVTCEQVRANYAQWSHLGRRALRAWLMLNGYSWRETIEAERCLR